MTEFHLSRAQITALSALTGLTLYTYQKREAHYPHGSQQTGFLGGWATATEKSKLHGIKVRLVRYPKQENHVVFGNKLLLGLERVVTPQQHPYSLFYAYPCATEIKLFGLLHTKLLMHKSVLTLILQQWECF